MNQTSLTLALFTHLGLLARSDAQKLYHELRFETIAEDYDTCHDLVKRLFEKLEINVDADTNDVVIAGETLKLKK